jgi:hypothetical protein
VRKELGEKPDSPPGGSNEPKSGERPEDPAQAMPKGGSPEDPTGKPPEPEKFPAWVTSLPPEIRDALVGGDAESIPAKYRHVIMRYNLWLQKQRGSSER